MAIDFEDETPQVEDSALSRISETAKRQVAAEQKVADLAAQLKTAERDLKKIQEQELPDLMLEVGMRSFTLDDGRGVTIKEDISASLAGDKKGPAIAWLKEHDFGDIISTDLEINYGKGDEEKARSLAQRLIAEGLIPKLTQNVNTATLKSLIRELMEKGQEVPLETLGAYQWRKTIIK